MSVVSFSLTDDQIKAIDKFTRQHGFATRSEFIRGLLRFVLSRPDLIDSSSVFPLVSPKEKSVKKIVSGFRKSKKYSDEFLTDLEKGLSESTYFSS